MLRLTHVLIITLIKTNQVPTFPKSFKVTGESIALKLSVFPFIHPSINTPMPPSKDLKQFIQNRVQNHKL